MGAEGNAIVYLLPNEETYVDFLKHRNIPSTEMKPAEDAPDVIPKIKDHMRKDRSFFEKSQVAFVSYIRAYKEHHCSYIFMLNQLYLPELLRGFAQLRIPALKEFTRTIIDYPVEDTDKIPYTDKKREADRKVKLANQKKNQEKEAKKLRQKKAAIERRKKIVEAKLAQLTVNTAEKDIEEINKDYSLMQQLKKRKISETQFDEEFMKTESLNTKSDTSTNITDVSLGETPTLSTKSTKRRRVNSETPTNIADESLGETSTQSTTDIIPIPENYIYIPPNDGSIKQKKILKKKKKTLKKAEKLKKMEMIKAKSAPSLPTKGSTKKANSAPSLPTKGPTTKKPRGKAAKRESKRTRKLEKKAKKREMRAKKRESRENKRRKTQSK
jgi:hypothetical protein